MLADRSVCSGFQVWSTAPHSYYLSWKDLQVQLHTVITCPKNICKYNSTQLLPVPKTFTITAPAQLLLLPKTFANKVPHSYYVSRKDLQVQFRTVITCPGNICKYNSTQLLPVPKTFTITAPAQLLPLPKTFASKVPRSYYVSRKYLQAQLRTVITCPENICVLRSLNIHVVKEQGGSLFLSSSFYSVLASIKMA
jgi:hypothetical protein